MKYRRLGILAVVLVGISATTIKHDKLYEISKNIEIFVNVYKELNANYVDDLDPSQLMRVGLDAIVGSLDPYTNYISESQVSSYRFNTEGTYDGIGAVVKMMDGYVTIIEPHEDSPVLKAGLQAGDQIIAIDGQSTEGKTFEEVTAFYRGVAGTSVRMKIKREGSPDFSVDITRSEVSIPNVPYSGFVDPNVAYISLTTFTPDAGKNIRKAYKKLQRENEDMHGLILDLRDNGGGLLREAIAISNIFVPKNEEVVSVKSKVRDRDETYRTLADPLDLNVPLVVLINKSSASASEIVSGVVQDLDRGVLMGQRSYGKGLVQNTKDVGYNSRVKITTSKYYIPSGRCIQSVEYKDGEPVDIADEKRSKFKTSKGRVVLDGGGVTPDIILPVEKKTDVMNALDEQFIIFKFANEYFQQMDTSLIEDEIVFDNFESFKTFVEKSGFEYETPAQKLLTEVKTKLEEEERQALIAKVNDINNDIETSKVNGLDANKEAIINQIEIALATRIFYSKGKAFQKLKNDKDIDAAIALLGDRDRYNSILATN
ncbi:MAG: S41 family peptidase [Saprospiraceae bacterium]|nr:S41 family peptidase [Saprospiraceae bacterium]